MVKNCGFQLQFHVASKEFLNAMVKNFPEHPPVGQRIVYTSISPMPPYSTVSTKHRDRENARTYSSMVSNDLSTCKIPRRLAQHFENARAIVFQRCDCNDIVHFLRYP